MPLSVLFRYNGTKMHCWHLFTAHVEILLEASFSTSQEAIWWNIWMESSHKTPQDITQQLDAKPCFQKIHREWLAKSSRALVSWSLAKEFRKFNRNNKETTTKAVNTLGTATFAEFWGTIVHVESMISVEFFGRQAEHCVWIRLQECSTTVTYCFGWHDLCWSVKYILCLRSFTQCFSGPFNSIQCVMIICHAWNNWRGRDRGSGCLLLIPLAPQAFHPLTVWHRLLAESYNF